ncbi:hypothetical protein F5Y18DRAFT_352714 [Xylariaceae sp. FL1019]|nr:hypothetical protein F5Y18DRAFT_352714 [Xylariaceae sp. FL1019]
MVENMKGLCEAVANVRIAPKVTDLPCEIIASVLGQLDDLRDLPSALLACRHFYWSYKEFPGLAVDILTSHHVHSTLLPYLVAVTKASRLPRPRVRSDIKELLDSLYDDPKSLVDGFRHMPLSIVLEMSYFHGLIEFLANDLASKAWDRLEEFVTIPPLSDEDRRDYFFDAIWCRSRGRREMKRHSGQPEILSLTSSEEFRFQRAFYRVALFQHLFGGDIMVEEECKLPSQQIDLFLSRHPPWVNEQLWCIRDHIASRKWVGHEEYEYVPPRIQRLLEPLLLHKLRSRFFEHVLETSMERQMKQMEQCRDFYFINEYRWSDEALKTLEPTPDPEDTDPGPFSSWKCVFTNSDFAPNVRGAFKYNRFNRRSAYVFWDTARAERYSLPELFLEIWETDLI